MTPDDIRRLSSTLKGDRTAHLRRRRRMVGYGGAGGFMAALLGYRHFHSGWWVLALFVGTVLGWRVATGRWPFQSGD